MKTILKFIFITFCIFNYSQNAFATEDQPGNLRVMVGIGEALRPLSYRIGIGSNDIGMLNINTIGVATYFNSSGYYVGVGPAYIVSNSSAGFFGAIGTDFKFLNVLYIKTELNTSISVKNYSVGSGMIGLGLYW